MVLVAEGERTSMNTHTKLSNPPRWVGVPHSCYTWLQRSVPSCNLGLLCFTENSSRDITSTRTTSWSGDERRRWGEREEDKVWMRRKERRKNGKTVTHNDVHLLM